MKPSGPDPIDNLGGSKSTEWLESIPPEKQGFHGNTSLAVSKSGTKSILNR